ncbi:Uncharacterized protein HZ326_5005 [Fusarium oxysporum f. sp. albedinis]|jgi:hypothetical protein|nr:Uncharacterized protein HZ326_5005 [Fusarium oxysporum f. sp. albedinis]
MLDQEGGPLDVGPTVVQTPYRKWYVLPEYLHLSLLRARNHVPLVLKTWIGGSNQVASLATLTTVRAGTMERKTDTKTYKLNHAM